METRRVLQSVETVRTLGPAQKPSPRAPGTPGPARSAGRRTAPLYMHQPPAHQSTPLLDTSTPTHTTSHFSRRHIALHCIHHLHDSAALRLLHLTRPRGTHTSTPHSFSTHFRLPPTPHPIGRSAIPPPKHAHHDGEQTRPERELPHRRRRRRPHPAQEAVAAADDAVGRHCRPPVQGRRHRGGPVRRVVAAGRRGKPDELWQRVQVGHDDAW